MPIKGEILKNKKEKKIHSKLKQNCQLYKFKLNKKSKFKYIYRN